MSDVIAFQNAGNGGRIPVSTGRPLPVDATPAVGGGVAYTDRTITSATGASQTLMAANAGRRSILIKNGASQAGINLLGGTAAIGGAGTVTLQAYEALALSGAACPVGAITAISTAAAYISAYEGA